MGGGMCGEERTLQPVFCITSNHVAHSDMQAALKAAALLGCSGRRKRSNNQTAALLRAAFKPNGRFTPMTASQKGC
jgi:hypothetical protein